MATKTNKLLQFLSFFLVLFLFVGQLAVFQLVPNVKADPDWLSGWQYRKSHVINSASDAGTGYQVRIKAHYGSGTDSGEDVYLNSHCRTDFGDVRLVFWVEVADDLSGYWDKYSGNPIFSNTNGYMVSVLKVDSTYYMYYRDSNDDISRATSTDKVTWTEDTANNPVLTKGSSGEWDSDLLFAPIVWKEGDTWYMLYTGYDGSSRRIGLATSSDGVSWTKDSNNPVLSGTETWEGNSIECDSIIKVDGTYYLWYGTLGETYRKRGLATSTDLISWTKDSNNPIFSSGSISYYPAFIFKYGDYYYLLLGEDKTKIYLWRDTNPTFYSSDREKISLKIEVGSDGEWDDYLVEAAQPLMTDITRSAFCDDEIHVYYGGGDGDGNRRIGLTTGGSVSQSNIEGNQTIYIYYGKSDATTTSNGDNTFLEFHDFECGTTEGLTVTAGSFEAYNYGGDYGYVLRQTDTSTGNRRGYWTATLFDDICIEGSWKRPSTTSGDINIILRKTDGSGGYLFAFRGSAYNTIAIRKFSNWADPTITDIASTSFTTDTSWHTIKISRLSSGSINFTQDSTSVSATDTAYTPDWNLAVWCGPNYYLWDNLRVRKYVDPEPGHGSWGSEESGEEYSYTFTETLSPSAILNQWQEQFRIWMETVTATETVTYLQEHIRVMQESLSPSESISYWQEQKHVFSETASPTATLNHWLEGMHVFFETVHPSTTLIHWIEVIFRFTEPLSVSEQLQPIQTEAVFTLTQTITPSETVTYLQEQQYVLTETAAPATTLKHWIEGIQVFYETFTETIQQTANMHYWVEKAYTFTQTITPSETVTYYQEHSYTFTQPSALTATLNYAKELAETFITNIESLNLQDLVSKTVKSVVTYATTGYVWAVIFVVAFIFGLPLTLILIKVRR